MRKSNEEFAVLWSAAESLTEAAHATGMSPTAASKRASYMRSRGVKLKCFREATREPMDAKRLNALARRAEKG